MPLKPRAQCAQLWLVLAWLAAALGALAPRAAAQPAMMRAELEWTRDARGVCPSADVLAREVEELVGHAVFVSDGAVDVVVHGGFDENDERVRAWFEARAADGSKVGTRELIGAPHQCVSLQHEVALVLAILLDRPASALAAEPRERTDEGARRHLSAHGGAYVGLLSGALPRVTPGVGLSFELGLSPRWRVRTDGAYWFPVSDKTNGLGAKLSAFTGGLALCPRWALGSSRFGMNACAGALLGALSASPRGLTGPERVSRLLAQATLELGLSAAVARFTTIFASAGVAIALTRPRFFYDRDDGSTFSVHRPASAGAIARIGVTIGGP